LHGKKAGLTDAQLQEINVKDRYIVNYKMKALELMKDNKTIGYLLNQFNYYDLKITKKMLGPANRIFGNENLASWLILYGKQLHVNDNQIKYVTSPFFFIEHIDP